MTSFDEQLAHLVGVLVRLTDAEGQPLYNGDEAKKLARQIMIGGRSRDERRFSEKLEPIDGRWIYGDGEWHRSKKTWAERISNSAFTYCGAAFDTYMSDRRPPPPSSVCQECQAAWKATGKPDPA